MSAVESRQPAILAQRDFRSLKVTRFFESLIKGTLVLCSAFSVFITIAIICLLMYESAKFFGIIPVDGLDPSSIGEFFFTTTWEPTANDAKFGIWPLISGTLLVTFIAMLVALPTGLITAIFLSEYAPNWLRDFLKPVLEVLAGIPTVVYGFFAFAIVTPFLKEHITPILNHWMFAWFFKLPVIADLFALSQFETFNAMSAGLLVGVLCLPTVASLSEDALRAVPIRLREAAYGMGGTRFDVSLKVVVPAALSGIISAFLLAIARAIGETMIVTLAAGARAQLTIDPRASIQTMTAYITTMAKGDISNFGPIYYSIYAVGATLFMMTFVLTLIGHFVRKRFREAYE